MATRPGCEPPVKVDSTSDPNRKDLPMENTGKNTLSDAAAPPIAPDNPAEADVPAIVLTAAQPGSGGRLPPLTPPTPPEHNPRDFGRYWPIAAAILTVDLPESAAAANRQTDNIAHHKSTREHAMARVAEIRDELAKRERGEQNKRGLMDRLLAGKPIVKESKTDLIEERDNLVAAISELNAQINDLEARVRDYPPALDGLRQASIPLVDTLKALAGRDIRTAYADAFILGFSFECDSFRELQRDLGDVLIAYMDAGVFEQGSIRASDEMVALVNLASPIMKAFGRQRRLTISAPWPNRTPSAPRMAA